MPNEFSQLIDDFKRSGTNPIIKSVVEQAFEELWKEQQIPRNGPNAHENFLKRIQYLTKTCTNSEIREAYWIMLNSHYMLMDYMERRI
jgi:hypothetical protein